MNRAQRGNILFLILLAVILFAALSYAVTSSVQGGGKNATQESMSAQVSVLENLANSIRAALLRMTTTGGYQLWQIDYSKTSISSMHANGACTTDACRLYNVNGGGLGAYQMPPQFWQSTTTCPSAANSWKGMHWFRNVPVKGIGIDTKAEMVVLYAGVSDELCKALNDKYGVSNPGGNPPSDSTSPSPETLYDYTGTLTADPGIDQPVDLGDTEASIAGKHMFCSRRGTCNYLWMVVYER